MAKIKVEVAKTSDYTNRVLAHDGTAGLLVVDKAGAQEVIDHPRVRQLISDGTLKESSGKVAEDDAAALEAAAEAERKAAEDNAAAEAKDEQDRLDAEAKAKAAAEKKAKK